MSKAKGQLKTILIGSIELRSGQELQVQIAPYNDAMWINIRRWYKDRHDAFKPTRFGINVALEDLAALRTLIRRAYKRAEADNLLPNKKKKKGS